MVRGEKWGFLRSFLMSGIINFALIIVIASTGVFVVEKVEEVFTEVELIETPTDLEVPVVPTEKMELDPMASLGEVSTTKRSVKSLFSSESPASGETRTESIQGDFNVNAEKGDPGSLNHSGTQGPAGTKGNETSTSSEGTTSSQSQTAQAIDWKSRFISRVEANKRYPVKAAQEGIEGTVRMKVVIGSDGQLRSSNITAGADSRLNQAARDAVRASVPFPQESGGDLVVEFGIRFHLN